jgi:hypothetical protein
MSVTHEDAAEALRLVREAGDRSETLRGYQSASPHLILWGCVYAAAYSFSYFRPHLAQWPWLVLVPIASVGDIIIGKRDRSGGDWTIFPILFCTFLVFILATAAIMQPHDPNQMGAFVPLVVAACYIALGVGAGKRILYTGVALGVLTLVGFFAFPAIFLLWMAVVGGGAMVLGGLWLRQV